MPAMDISRQYGYSLQAVVKNNSSLSATLKLQCSNDNENFSDISGATLTLNANGSQMINLDALHYCFIRAVITYTSGTADVIIFQNTKGN